MLGREDAPRSEGLEREGQEAHWTAPQPYPAGTLPAPACGHVLATGPQRSRWVPEQMPEPIRGPRTCQGSGPGMRRGPVPGRILNGLPAYLHVLINHKMSPRGRIKLSISLLTSTSSPHTRCSPPDTPASPRPRAFPLPSFLSFRKYSVYHCHGRSPGGEGKGKITGSGGEVNWPDAFISKA